MTEFLVALVLLGADDTWPTLEVTEFPQEYLIAPPNSGDNPGEYGNGIVEHWLMPGSPWIVGQLSEYRAHHHRYERQLGVFAVHRFTREIRFVRMSPQPTNESDYNYGPAIPRRPGVCGVSLWYEPWTEEIPSEENFGRGYYKSRLYEWDVDNGTVEFVKKDWFPLPRLARFLSDTVLDYLPIVEMPARTWDGTIELTARSSEKTLRFEIDPDGAWAQERWPYVDTQWFARGPDKASLIVCQSIVSDGDKFAVECLSPMARKGHVWSLSVKDIAEELGAEVFELLPPQMPPSSSDPWLVMVHGLRSREIWIIDRRNGDILRRVDVGTEGHTWCPAASVQGDIVAFADQVTEGDDHYDMMLRVYRISTGERIGSLDLTLEFGRGLPFAVTDDGHILITDRVTIWELDPQNDFASRAIFSLRRLREPEDSVSLKN